MSSLACKNVKIQDTNGNVASTITWDGNNVTFDKPVLVPTAAAGTNNTQVATTAMVHSAITNDLHVTGSAPIYACRAWVNFDGTPSTPAIRASGNISSVTRNGTGNYTINFATAMPDANYACTNMSVTDTSNQFNGNGYYSTYITYKSGTQTATSIGFLTGYSNQANASGFNDSANIAMTVFR